jgi:hypothetical protein
MDITIEWHLDEVHPAKLLKHRFSLLLAPVVAPLSPAVEVALAQLAELQLCSSQMGRPCQNR